jgi:hypothetical protein
VLSDSEILSSHSHRVNDSIEATTIWRTELRDDYNVMECNQWLAETHERQLKDGMPIRTINKLSPVIDAVSGFEIQNRSAVKYVPRVSEPEKIGYSDMLNDTVKYIENESQSAFHNTEAFKDMLICGVGVTDTTINYDDNPDGEVKIERIFPYFVLWDITARAKNLEDANWVIRAKIVDKELIGTLLNEDKDDDKVEEDIDLAYYSGGATDGRFLDFFDTVATTKSLAIIYEYQWRDKVPFYRVENPLIGFTGNPLDPYIQQVLAFAKMMQEKYRVNLATDRIFSINKEDYKEIKGIFEALDLPFKTVKQKKFKYYRATVIGDKVLNKSENFSQTGFSLKFMTGKFSETRQYFYGMLRAAKEPQRLLNQSISDYEGFLRTIPKGGVEIESDAVPNMQAFVETYTKAREVTIYNPGGLAKTRPKVSPPVPSGLLDMINLAATSIMETTGVTQDFMGTADSKLMTATLNRQMVRQGLTVLSCYFDAKKFYMINQGKIFIDCIKVLMDNAEGRLIRVMDSSETRYIPLLKENVANQYDVIIEDIPQTPSERQDTFEKMMQLAQLLANKPNPVDITPLVMQYSPLKEDEIGKITELMKPPPPPEPDPIVQQMLMSEAKLKEALATKETAEAQKAQMEAMLKQQELETNPQSHVEKIMKIQAETQFTNAKAATEINKLIEGV